jgi:hypothetical protein
MASKADALIQVDAVISKYNELRSRSRWDDCSDLPSKDITAVATLICDTINRFAPPGSEYIESMRALQKRMGIESAVIIPHLAGVLSALQLAYQAGYLDSISELIRADLFSDFVEMSEHLLSEGYKDPAAVVVGSVLEEHLRRLCMKNGIAISAGSKSKKADQMNADLAAKAAYSKLDQKSITSWLDLRNKAAHGKYDEYSKDQVALLIQGVQNFLVRNPA